MSISHAVDGDGIAEVVMDNPPVNRSPSQDGSSWPTPCEASATTAVCAS